MSDLSDLSANSRRVFAFPELRNSDDSWRNDRNRRISDLDIRKPRVITLMTDIPAPRLNSAASRFEIVTPHGKAVLKFVQHDGTIDLQHTVVPHALEGGGYGAALARAALDHARQNGLKVIPTCSFVRTFVKRHHEYDDLLATTT
jgi:uncharacterized protein